MRARIQKQDSSVIVYDADSIPQPDEKLFDIAHWQSQGAVVGQARGRGTAWFLETEFGSAVLRQYLRGGQVARLSRDRYFFTGYENSRPLQEFDVMTTLVAKNLPVPKPLAAICRRSGLLYTGALMTRRLPDAVALADQLGAIAPGSQTWRDVGATIRRFHQAGVHHADLNARNILLSGGDIYLIDFDRARVHEQPVDGKDNLQRLHRSFTKRWPDGAEFAMPGCWEAVLEAYRP